MRGIETTVAEITLKLASRRATRKLGGALASAASPGDLIVLEGDLGAGKTFLVRGLARGLGVPTARPITSPTFTLVQEHAARLPLVHADLYRLAHEDELAELGLRERIGADALVVIEWGDRFSDALGNEGLWIWLALDDDGRRAQLLARGPRGEAFLQRVGALLSQAGFAEATSGK